MLGSDIIVRHVLAFVVPCAFALIVFLASRVTELFWFRFTGVVLALLTFYFSAKIMNSLLFARVRAKETTDPTTDRNASDDEGA